MGNIILTNEGSYSICVGRFVLPPNGAVPISEKEMLDYKDRGYITEAALEEKKIALREEGQHYLKDATNFEATVDATNLATANTLATSLKAKYNAHRASLVHHRVADATNIVDAANATTEGTLVALSNQIKAKLNAHGDRLLGVHAFADGAAITMADATNTATAVPLINACKAFYNSHLASVASILPGAAFRGGIGARW